ncbi:phage tail protein [Kosakonia cowanii]|nr:phage tail protein [Kosakonia cowanii]
MSKKNDNAITLAKPVVRGDEKITRVTITDRIRQAGSLRGLKLVSVLNMDVDSVAVLLTRVTSPLLKPDEINELDTRDFISLSEALVPFLTPAGSGASDGAETENP